MAIEQHNSIRICKQCGIDISHRHGKAIFCSDKCFDIFHGRHKQRTIFNCLCCGVDISDRNANVKYCSDSCRSKARIKSIEQQKKWREDAKKRGYKPPKYPYRPKTPEQKAREAERARARRETIDGKIKYALAARKHRHKRRMLGLLKRDKIASCIRNSIKNGHKSSYVFNCTGYTIDELKVNLERQFTKKMTWDKFLKGEIHIDHIIPISKFDMENQDDVKACWALSNIRPMWAKDNIAKGAKVLTLL